MSLDYGSYVELIGRLRAANPGLDRGDAAEAVLALWRPNPVTRPGAGGRRFVKLDDGRELELALPEGFWMEDEDE